MHRLWWAVRLNIGVWSSGREFALSLLFLCCLLLVGGGCSVALSDLCDRHDDAAEEESEEEDLAFFYTGLMVCSFWIHTQWCLLEFAAVMVFLLQSYSIFWSGFSIAQPSEHENVSSGVMWGWILFRKRMHEDAPKVRMPGAHGWYGNPSLILQTQELTEQN
jgi:hypothetical protein